MNFEQWQAALEELADDGVERHWILLRLAPYSYSCSPIERYWSVFKAGVKAQIRERRQELLGQRVQGGETLTARRFRILSEVAVAQSLPSAAIHKLQAFFNNVQRNIALASNGEDVPTGR